MAMAKEINLLFVGAGDSVTVIIHSLSLDEESPIVVNKAVQKLYVEYVFLGIPLQDTETPYSLAKPSPNKHISFNFARTFSVDIDNFYKRRQLLASMLLPDDPDNGRIPFTVISEPEDDDGDCEDVGVAYVSLPDILETEKDLVERDIPIYDVEDKSRQVGTLNVTVKCLDALLAVRLEMATADD